ncbi:hypothetical protein ACF0H5_005432 [Mactra antiquata]
MSSRLTIEEILTNGHSDVLMAQHQAIQKQKFDNDPKVTVTIPKSHLDFLNMVFPPSPSDMREAMNEDEIVAETIATSTVTLPSLLSEEHGTSMSADVGLNEGVELRSETILTSAIQATVPLEQTILISPDTTEMLYSDTTTNMINTSSLTAADHHVVTVGTNEETIEYIENGHSDIDKVTSTVVNSDDDKQSPGSLSSDNGKSPESDSSRSTKISKKSKRITKALTFPPCEVCSGKASGLHYGANTCEACKGFFRRYLLKKYDFKCSNDEKCEISSQSRRNCSFCRLQKCLALGMCKEKVQMGRYTLSKRTEAIKSMNMMKMYESDSNAPENTSNMDLQLEIIGRQCIKTSNLNQSKGFSFSLAQELTQAMINMKPFGPDIVTDEQVEEKLKSYSEHYKRVVNLYGEMKPVSKEDFNKLYKEFSIDVDGRIKELRECSEYIEDIVTSYCNFAKHIPGFYKLPYKDQSNLLKTSRAEVFLVMMHKGYSASLQIFLDNKGKGLHINEFADKFVSRDLCITMGNISERWQKLKLSKQETAVLMALVLMYPDRCKIENSSLVESIQQSLADLLLDMLKTTHQSDATKRFTKMIDMVTYMRNFSETFLNEFKKLCNDEVIIEEAPYMTDFLLEDDRCEKNQ